MKPVEKSAHEMYVKLERLNAEIANKRNKLLNLHRRQQIASQGNAKYISNKLNKNSYTNENFKRHVLNAALLKNEIKTLTNKYNKSSTKYRRILRLPSMGYRGESIWQRKGKNLSFRRTKRYVSGTPRTNFKYGIPMSTGVSRNSEGATFHVYLPTFYPNVQLMNALLAKNKAAQIIRNSVLKHIYRPPKGKNTGGGMYLKMLERTRDPKYRNFQVSNMK
jgi:hypothetical protein